LFLAVFEFGFFQLDEDVGRGGLVLVEDADVGPLLLAAETDGVLDFHPTDRVTQVVAQDHYIELANRFFRRQLDRLAPDQAGDVRRFFLCRFPDLDSLFQRCDLRRFELAEFVGAVFEQVGECGHRRSRFT